MNKKYIENKNLNTDLAIEMLKIKPNVIDNINVSDIKLSEKEAKLINKKQGNYITLEFDTIYELNFSKIESILINNLNKLLKRIKIKAYDSVLVVGLGNENSVCDSLGPKVINNINVTRNIKTTKKIREISTINTSVMGKTGLDAVDILKGLVTTTKPKLVIVIDALKTTSLTRLNKTIQITDTGIHPGSGVGNKRKEISIDTLEVPVIAIGIPTVIEMSAIAIDTINNINTNYVDIGTIDEKLYKLIMNISEEDMIVTPKDIDNIINILSDIIGNAINKCLIHK